MRRAQCGTGCSGSEATAKRAAQLASWHVATACPAQHSMPQRSAARTTLTEHDCVDWWTDGWQGRWEGQEGEVRTR